MFKDLYATLRFAPWQSKLASTLLRMYLQSLYVQCPAWKGLYEQTTYLKELNSFSFFFKKKKTCLTLKAVSLSLKGAITEPCGNKDGRLADAMVGYLTFIHSIFYS